MLFFSTPLWRKSTPIVHKINPQVAADPALCVKHAGTFGCVKLFFSSSCWRAVHCAESHAARPANVCSNTSVWENPSSHTPPVSLRVPSCVFLLLLLLLFFFLKANSAVLQRTLIDSEWAVQLEDILKSFVFMVEEIVKVKEHLDWFCRVQLTTAQ